MSGRRPANISDSFLALEDVTLRSGERLVFKHTNWTLRRDEQWAIIGPNGSGKSFLAAALAGQGTVVEGEIRHQFDPAPPASDASAPLFDPEQSVAHISPELHREIVQRESSFYQSRWHSGLGEGQMTVGHYLSQANLAGVNPFEIAARLGSPRLFRREREAWMQRLGITALAPRKLIYLSNGEMRKVLLAGALLQFPRLLILDDPFSGLDAATRMTLKEVIQGLMAGSYPVLLVTSRLDELPARTTHLALVLNHRIAAQGPKAEVLRHPSARQLRAQQAGDPTRRDPPRNGRKRVVKPSRRRPEVLVEMKNITVKYGGKFILRDVNWTVRAGEHWALLGPNGSGKSTLLSLIQVDNPLAYAQDIRLFGIAPDSTQALWRVRRRLGWVSPELHLHYPRQWSCLEVVCSGFTGALGLPQRPSARQRRIARERLQKLRLARFAETPFGSLSAGQQRLVLLARAVVHAPRLIILDEPGQGLDTAHRNLILAAVDQIVHHSGASLIFVTHHPREMPQCITHLLQLKRGQIARQGPRGS